MGCLAVHLEMEGDGKSKYMLPGKSLAASATGESCVFGNSVVGALNPTEK